MSGWENQCHDYFNFSMPGTSEAKTATTGVTTAKPRISRSDQAVSAAQGLQAFPPQAAGQQQTPFQNSAGGQMLPPRTNGTHLGCVLLDWPGMSDVALWKKVAVRCFVCFNQGPVRLAGALWVPQWPSNEHASSGQDGAGLSSLCQVQQRAFRLPS